MYIIYILIVQIYVWVIKTEVVTQIYPTHGWKTVNNLTTGYNHDLLKNNPVITMKFLLRGPLLLVSTITHQYRLLLCILSIVIF